MVVEFLNNILGTHRHIKGTCIAEKFDWQDLSRGPLDITNLLHTRYITCGPHGFSEIQKKIQVSPIIVYGELLIFGCGPFGP